MLVILKVLMSAFLHTLGIVVAIALAVVWLVVPGWQGYSLQLFLLLMLTYFGLKRLGHARLWYVAPRAHSLELPLLTLAFLVLIGATGQLDSPFFALNYVYLFFLILVCSVGSSLVVLCALMIFYLGFLPQPTIPELISLSTLPLVTVLFLFGRSQYDEAHQMSQLVKSEENLLQTYVQDEASTIKFLTKFLQPKVAVLQQLSLYPEYNGQQLRQQLTLLGLEIDKFVGKLHRTAPRGSKTGAANAANPAATEQSNNV